MAIPLATNVGAPAATENRAQQQPPTTARGKDTTDTTEETSETDGPQNSTTAQTDQPASQQARAAKGTGKQTGINDPIVQVNPLAGVETSC